jgi:type I restriction enzyme S subunit
MYQGEYPEACAIQNQLIRFRAKAGVSGVFASHVFRHCQQSGVFARIALQTTSIAHLGGSRFQRLLLAWPKSELEQRAIATALSDVDALLGALNRLIAKKRDIKQAAMQQLLTGKTRLPGFHDNWEVKTVAELEKLKLVKLSRGQVISKKDIDNTPGDFPIYSSSIHNNGLFGRYGKFMFDEELITWSVDGGGNFFHRRKHKFSVTNVCGFMRVDTARIDYRFFAAELQLLHSRKSFDYQSKAHPSVVRKEYEVQLPPRFEQSAIAKVLTDMDAELAALEHRLEKTRALKQGMIQELLTGRTRLV